jgi:NAD(P)H-nitrite reductase large subunit
MHSADCSILLIGEEDRLPYKRTQLSKTIVSGFAHDALRLQSLECYEADGIELLIDQRVTAIRPASHSLSLYDGRNL